MSSSSLAIAALSKWTGPKLDISDSTTHVPWLNAIEAAMSVTTHMGVLYRDILNGKVVSINNNTSKKYKACKEIVPDPLASEERKFQCSRGDDLNTITAKPLLNNPSNNPKCLICQQDLEAFQITDEEKKKSQDVLSAQGIIWTKLIESLSVKDQASFQLVPFTNVSSIWEKIQLRLRNTTTTNSTTLFEEFNNLKLGPKEDVISFVNRIQEKRSNLQSINENVSDGFCKAQLLKGLRDNEKFAASIEIWNSADGQSKSFEDASVHFLKAQQRISCNQEGSVNNVEGKNKKFNRNNGRRSNNNDQQNGHNNGKRNQHNGKRPCLELKFTGKCKFGDKCKYSHAKQDTGSKESRNSNNNANENKTGDKEICSFY
jgi:hypothetical protein